MKVGQEYILNTFDLEGYIKALPLIRKFPNEYRKHVVSPHAFRTAMHYFGMVTGCKCRGPGYAKIFIEAELVTSGCLDSVLSRKACAKDLFGLKIVTEAIERLLIKKFVEEENVPVTENKDLFNLGWTCSRGTLNITMRDSSILTILEKYVIYLFRRLSYSF